MAKGWFTMLVVIARKTLNPRTAAGWMSPLMLTLCCTVGCGQSSAPWKPKNDLAEEKPDDPKSSVTKNGQATKASSANADSSSSSNPNSNSNSGSDTKDEPIIADTPMPIAGAFLTCWTGIDATIGELPTSDSGVTKIGCGLLSSTGEKSPINVPLDQWRIFSKGREVLDQPISGIAVASNPFWSVEFSLPAGDVARTKIAIKNAPTTVFPAAGMNTIYSLRKSKRFGGADNPKYFYMGGGGTRRLPGCPNGGDDIRNQPRLTDVSIPVTISGTDPARSSPNIAVQVSGLCGIDNGRRVPRLIATSKNSNTAIFSQDIANQADSVIMLSLPPGRYDLKLTVEFTARDFEDLAFRGFFAIPLAGNIEVGRICTNPDAPGLSVCQK